MEARRIYLKNFRNYALEEVNFNGRLNVFYGDNAQGKTNLLESIFLGAIGRSFKPVSEREMIKFGEKFSDVVIDYFSGGREMTNKMRLFTEKKKMVSVNNVPLGKMSELVGNLTVVIFTPEELSLVKEGPGLRRRFVDMAISQIRPRYMQILSSYNKVLEQKNKLLKTGNKSSLFVWNEQLAAYGAEIVIFRSKFIRRLMSKAEELHREISLGDETLSAQYKTFCDLEDTENLSTENISVDNVKNAMLSELEQNSERELILGQAVTGPHRDDVVFYINGNNAKTFGSQGQQRTVVLALKLAQKEIFFEETGENPLLLLDDITGELDIKRREYLFSKIKDSQVFITCTDTDRIENSADAVYFKVENGRITRAK